MSAVRIYKALCCIATTILAISATERGDFAVAIICGLWLALVAIEI